MKDKGLFDLTSCTALEAVTLGEWRGGRQRVNGFDMAGLIISADCQTPSLKDLEGQEEDWWSNIGYGSTGYQLSRAVGASCLRTCPCCGQDTE